MERDEALLLMAYAKGTWPAMVVDDTTQAVWIESMANVDAVAARQAVDALAVAGEKWPPAPQYLAGLAVVGRATPFDVALRAVLEFVRERGRYNPPDGVQFHDPAIGRLFHAMSWQEWCNLEDPISAADYAHLRDAYQARGIEAAVERMRELHHPTLQRAELVAVERQLDEVGKLAERAIKRIEEHFDDA